MKPASKQLRRGPIWSRISPGSVPILFFAGAILVGTLVLKSPWVTWGQGLSWVDALFTAVSATCVTGLTVVDTGSTFNSGGQGVILLLIQIGGLGIMTFTSLAVVVAGRRLSMQERAAVSQPLIRDSRGSLRAFLLRVVGYALAIEAAGAGLLWLAARGEMGTFSAIFHAVSAFCNAGFSLREDNLIAMHGNLAVNAVVMLLIVLGGLGFVVLLEGASFARARLRGRTDRVLSDHFRIVVGTSLTLILVGAALIFFTESIHFHAGLERGQLLLASLFQSVTARTAGFNTVAIGSLTNVSLLLLIFLMFIGGGPGSCAGGIKVTTLRVMVSFVLARLRGRDQVVINGRMAVDRATVHRALTLVILSSVLIGISVLVLDFTEGGTVPHPEARGQFLEIFFESVSAFGTVGLSTGLTASLSVAGKFVIVLLMFVGRLGPLVLMGALQDMQREVLYALPEETLTVG